MRLPFSVSSTCLLSVLIAGVACGQTSQPAVATPPTSQPAASQPDAPKFDPAGSDAKAIEIADRTMEAMGGQDAWDQTRVIAWTFFGGRKHVWDRHANLARVDSGDGDVTVINLETGEGRAWAKGQELEAGGELTKRLNGAMSAWINDSYWLVMPYKLKDPGVTLRYAGQRTNLAQQKCDVIQVTYTNVGNTPNNRYDIYIDPADGLMAQWDFYRNANDEEPGFQLPWTEWKKHGDILLSGERGEGRGGRIRLEDIGVYDEAPLTAFTSPDPVVFPTP